MYDANKIIKGWERCKKCNMSPIAPQEAHEAYYECEYTVGMYCNQEKLIFETIELLKEQKEMIQIYKYQLEFIQSGLTEWSQLIADGKAEVVCETDNHERKTVITFKMI